MELQILCLSIGVGVGGCLAWRKMKLIEIKSYLYFCLTLTPAQSLIHSKYAINNFVQFNQRSPIAYSMQSAILGTAAKRRIREFVAHIS